MSVKGQSFTGDTTGALVNFGVGAAGSVYTNGYTHVCLAKTSSANWGMGGGYSDSVGGTEEAGLLVSDNTGGRLFSVNDFTAGFPDPGVDSNGINDDVWRWHVITKPAGSAHYRYHYADLATLTWSHGESASSANHADGATVVAFSTWSVYAMGFDSGDMAVLAIFNYAMTDQQVQDACTKILRNLYAAGGGAPKIGWSFPEKMYANGALFGDFTQGGGNETLRQLTASSADPPGFDMGIVVEADTAWATAGGGSAVGLNSPSFSCSANSLIVCEAQVDGTGGAPGGWTIGDSLGNSLPWIEIGTVQQAGSGGYVRVWSAFTTSAQSGITANVDFQTNNAKAVKVTTYLGTDPATPPVSKLATTSATNDATPSVTNTYAGGWIAGSGLDWNALGTPTSADQSKGYNVSGLISGISVRETSQRMAGGATVPLDFDAAGTGTPDWAIKMWEIVPAPLPVVAVTGNPGVENLPPHILLRIIQATQERGPTAAAIGATPETGVVTVGFSGAATVVKVATPIGRAVIGLSGSAVAAKIKAQSSTVAVGLSGAAVAKKVMAQASTVAIGLSARGVAVKVAPNTGTVAVGLSGSGVEVKKAVATGVAAIAFTPYGPTQGQRVQSGRCVMGLSGRASVVKVSTPVARSVVGMVGVGTARKTAPETGVTTIGISGRGTNVKHATSASSVSLGVSCVATARTIRARTGVASLGVATSAIAQRKQAIVTRVYVGFSSYGDVYHAPPPPTVTLLKELTLTTPYRTRLSTPYGTELDSSGNEVSLRWTS